MNLRPGEVEVLLAAYPSAHIEDRPDGTGLVRLPALPLPIGWSSTTTDAWFVVPVGYPGAMPDCFWAAPDLRLATGALPSNSGPQPIGGSGPELGLWFSWHLQAWTPATDQLVTYAHFVESRLRRAA